MSSSTKRSQTPGGVLDDAAPLLFAVPVLIVVAVGWGALHLAARVDDRPAPPGNPINLGTGLADGSVKWTTTATVITMAIAAVIVLLAVLIGLGIRKLVRRGTRIDRAARYMGRGRQIEGLTAKGAGGVAKRLGVDGEPGLVLGRAVYNGQLLYQDWESTAVDIWGTRAGKSSTRAIPAIVAAPGAVIATSNKRDLVDATRLPRSSKGTMWVFDPQDIVGETARWWWNPLRYVTDEAKATTLASLFIGASREPGARTDAFFDGQGRNLISVFLLAAATGSKPITEVYVWLSRPNDDEPLRILQTAGYEMQAVTLNGIMTSPEKQRGGVYGTAQLIMSFLANRSVTAWVTPTPGAVRAEFAPEKFVRSADTLHSLSKEGDGADAGPLIAAMTAIICEAAEKYATTQPGGRMPVPMVVVLDEAANVCRWNQLPNLYSHYGSRGILISTFLQSWAQGEDAWGTGMTKMWEAANIAIYGGGSNETKFLEMLSQVVGEYEHSQVSTSRQAGGGRSTSHQLHTDRILSVADLGAMPRGRFVILASGCVPTLGRAQPWFMSKNKDAIAASIAASKASDV